MKILFADSMSDDHLTPLRKAGHAVTVDPSITKDDLADRLGGVDILVVRSTGVDATAIAAADQLGLIVRAGASTDTIDIHAASAAGVYVCNVPGRNAVAVAELTFALLLAIDRHIADGVADLRQGRWNKASHAVADGLLGKTLAIVGVGDIGLAVASRAKAFGIGVVALRKDDRPPAAQARIRSVGIRLVDSVDDLLSDADIVSLHVPSTDGTVGLVDDAFLARLRPGAVLINTSRADVIDHEALVRALDRTDLRVGLDVWPDEPGSGAGGYDHPLARHPSVIGSHHIGASTAQAQRSVADGTIEVVEAYLAGEVVNCVNLTEGTAGSTRLSIRHRDRVGVLAAVFGVLRSGGLNIQEMHNQVFTGAGAAVATIDVAGDVDEPTLSALGDIDDVLAAARLPSPDGD